MHQVGYAFNGDGFAFEVFPDEVVVLDVIDGAYYALGGAAPLIWQALVEGHAPGAIAAAAARACDVSEESVAEQLRGLTERLVAERILVETAPAAGAPAIAGNGEGCGFAALTFEKHVDMQDLLTLDPIHEVDRESGWPHR